MVIDPRSADEAIGWLIRQRDPAFADWEGLTSWLEADQANASAYAELAAREEAVAERLTATGLTNGGHANDDQAATQVSSPIRRRGWIAGMMAVAASAAAVFGAYQLMPRQSLYTVATPAEVQRTLTLAAGTTIALNGGTEIELDRNDPRYAALTAGEALFDVAHDPASPFRVQVAGAELVDLGTRFNVVRGAGLTEVAVAEGVVMYNPEREAVRLHPGRRLRARDGEATVSVGPVATDAVGSWTEGRLIYDHAPLSEVALDLTRTIGKSVRVDPAIAGRPVTAVIQLPRDRAQLAARLEKLLDVKVTQTDSDWMLTTSR